MKTKQPNWTMPTEDDFQGIVTTSDGCPPPQPIFTIEGLKAMHAEFAHPIRGCRIVEDKYLPPGTFMLIPNEPIPIFDEQAIKAWWKRVVVYTTDPVAPRP